MPRSLAQVWLHIVFSTKDRAPFLQNEEFREEMFRMLSHFVNETGCRSYRTGGWVDHVHIVCGLGRTVTISQLIERVKSETSGWAKKAGNGHPAFTWQRGYGVFSVSPSNLDQVDNYVEHQERHHNGRTFQDEFRALCQKNGVQIDERYVWD